MSSNPSLYSSVNCIDPSQKKLNKLISIFLSSISLIQDIFIIELLLKLHKILSILLLPLVNVSLLNSLKYIVNNFFINVNMKLFPAEPLPIKNKIVCSMVVSPVNALPNTYKTYSKHNTTRNHFFLDDI